MIINTKAEVMEIEERDVEYILTAYLRAYLFQARNQTPKAIVVPMFSSVPHPLLPGVRVPIQYVPELSDIAVEIKIDGSNVPKATRESEAAADKREEAYKMEVAAIDKTKQTLDDIAKEPIAEPVKPIAPPAPASPPKSLPPLDPNRKPKLAPNPATGPSEYGGSRNVSDQMQIKRDLEADSQAGEVDESKEKLDNETVDRLKKILKEG